MIVALAGAENRFCPRAGGLLRPFAAYKALVLPEFGNPHELTEIENRLAPAGRKGMVGIKLVAARRVFFAHHRRCFHAAITALGIFRDSPRTGRTPQLHRCHFL